IDDYRLQVRPGAGLVARDRHGSIAVIGDGPHARGPAADGVLAASTVDAARAAVASAEPNVPHLCMLQPGDAGISIVLHRDVTAVVVAADGWAQPFSGTYGEPNGPIAYGFRELSVTVGPASPAPDDDRYDLTAGAVPGGGLRLASKVPVEVPPAPLAPPVPR